jgi:phosphomannomutase/phosphoglucomutase
MLSKTDRTLADLASELPQMINTPELRIDCPDDKKFSVVARVAKRLREDPNVRGVVDIDGVRAKFDGGWGLVRASNTQPALVMRVEAVSEDRLQAIKSAIDAHVEAAASSG